MKRSEFLKRLGLGIAAIPMGAKLLAEVKEMKMPNVMDDEAGNWPDDVPPRYVDPLPKDFDGFTFSHYEEPWIHKLNPWPLQINDQILFPDETVYIVTAMMYGEAVLTPMDGRKKPVRIYRSGDQLRFYGGDDFHGYAEEAQYIKFGNLNSQL